MLVFYLIAGAAALAVSIVLARPLFFARREATGRDAADAQVFRDQLAEIDRDLARGTIGAAEADGARAEVSRRLIQAAGRAEAETPLNPGPRGRSRLVAIATLVATPALATALYLAVGSPGLRDQPLADRVAAAAANRPSQAEAEEFVAGQLPRPNDADSAEFLAVLERLEKVVADRPNDAQGQLLLGNTLARVGRWQEAHQAYARHIELAGPAATAEVHANRAEAMILAAGGYVSPEAESAIRDALRIDPKLAPARYYAGLALRQAGETEHALAVWRGLRADSPPDAPWLSSLDAIIAEIAPDSAPPGPSAEDMAAAATMTAEERSEMIAGMVARLENRLTTEGGELEDWVRLMNAYVQLDRKDDALRIYALAQAAQTEDGAAGFLKEQALLLGLPVQ